MLAHEIRINDLGFAILDVYIKPHDATVMEKVKFKVDTGANRTTISMKRLVELGYNEEWIKTGKLLEGNDRPTAATGLPVDDCYVIMLPEIHIGGWVGYNWPFMTSLSAPFKFLLGTDSMRFFNWHFDYEKEICSFNFIPGKRTVLFNNKEQSIHALDDVG